MLSHSRDYLYISHSNKDRSYYSLSQIQYTGFRGSGGGSGSSGTSTTHFYQKVDF